MKQSTATETPIQNKRVAKKICEAFEMVKAVNELNMLSVKGNVDRAVIERVVNLAYRDVSPLLHIFIEKEITRTVDILDHEINVIKAVK